jgi:hypothetical protein
MKIKAIFLLAAMFPLASCMAANDTAQMPVIVGGYGVTEITEDVKTAALFAVQTQSKRENKQLELLEVSKAMQQVVAGMNYQLELTLKNGEAQYHATVIVFRSLDAHYKLVSWQWLPTQGAM